MPFPTSSRDRIWTDLCFHLQYLLRRWTISLFGLLKKLGSRTTQKCFLIATIFDRHRGDSWNNATRFWGLGRSRSLRTEQVSHVIVQVGLWFHQRILNKKLPAKYSVKYIIYWSIKLTLVILIQAAYSECTWDIVVSLYLFDLRRQAWRMVKRRETSVLYDTLSGSLVTYISKAYYSSKKAIK